MLIKSATLLYYKHFMIVIYDLKDRSPFNKSKLCNNYGTDREGEVMRERCRERAIEKQRENKENKKKVERGTIG